MAANHISSLKESIVIVDTHLFIETPSGYYPALPMYMILSLKPDRLILVTANSEEILRRRKTDSTRARDIHSENQIKTDIDVDISMISSLSIMTGAQFEI